MNNINKKHEAPEFTLLAPNSANAKFFVASTPVPTGPSVGFASASLNTSLEGLGWS